MEVFDVFTGFNVDFNLSVKHDGNTVKIVFAPQTDPPCSPINIAADKTDVIEPVELQTLIKEAMEDLGVAFSPISEQIAAMKKVAEKAADKKPSGAAKPKALKDDAACSKHIESSKAAIKNKKDITALNKVKDDVLKFKKGSHAITAALRKELEDLYIKLVEIADAAAPSLFGGGQEEIEGAF